MCIKKIKNVIKGVSDKLAPIKKDSKAPKENKNLGAAPFNKGVK